jgi:hypothetical protein
MCIVIDTNLFSSICNIDSHDHGDFKPVLEWVLNSKAKILYGGSTYESEVKKHSKFRRLLFEFEHKGKAQNIIKEYVNNVEEFLKPKFIRVDFDDHHIIAILLVSGCKLLCSKDSGLVDLLKSSYKSQSIKNIKKQFNYINTTVRPKIYKSTKNADLLCDRNIVVCTNIP